MKDNAALKSAIICWEVSPAAVQAACTEVMYWRENGHCAITDLTDLLLMDI
jgi:hypothetical protein